MSLRLARSRPPRSSHAAASPAFSCRVLEACAQLDGIHHVDLQRLAYRLYVQISDAADVLRLRAVGHALIDLRRSGETHYDAYAHAQRTAAEAYFADLPAATRVARASLAVGEHILVTGEPQCGLVLQRIVIPDPYEGFPAPWFLVAADTLRRCRAHGADELEPTPAAPCRHHAPAGRDLA